MRGLANGFLLVLLRAGAFTKEIELVLDLLHHLLELCDLLQEGLSLPLEKAVVRDGRGLPLQALVEADSELCLLELVDWHLLCNLGFDGLHLDILASRALTDLNLTGTVISNLKSRMLDGEWLALSRKSLSLSGFLKVWRINQRGSQLGCGIG